MSKDPFTIDPGAPLGTAIDLMRGKSIRHLPVMDDAGRPIGHHHGPGPQARRLRSGHRGGPVGRGPASVSAKLWRLGSLPVIHDGRFVGLLTERDIPRAVARGGKAGRVDSERFVWEVRSPAFPWKEIER